MFHVVTWGEGTHPVTRPRTTLVPASTKNHRSFHRSGTQRSSCEVLSFLFLFPFGTCEYLGILLIKVFICLQHLKSLLSRS